ncbi:MAG: proline racemase family protein, partial [Rhodanobacter sp.]
RSPCGTGCCARMAVLHERGLLKVSDHYVGLSIIDSRFDCAIEATADVGGVAAIIPSLSGRAWITGTHQHMLDPSDPWPDGYRLSDTWPDLVPRASV